MQKIARQTKKKGAVASLRNTLKEKISEAATNLQKFCVFGVKSKIESFDLMDTSTDKNPTLLKRQQESDPFIQSIKHFVENKILPTKRYRNLIKTWGPL